MKRHLIRVSAAALLASGALHAQAMKNYTFHLANGATVLYQTYNQADLKSSGNTIQRTMTDGPNRNSLGFQLQVERLPGDPIRFRLSMGPMIPAGMWGYFGQTAPPREIQNGDRVLLDVLHEPGTGRTIFDTFQVGVGVEMQYMPPSKTIPQVPESGRAIHLSSPEFLQGGKTVAGSATSLNGSSLSVTVPGKGRFSFSTKADPGFRIEAIAEGTMLMFVSGIERYDIQCTAPIIDGANAWYLWVRHDPSPDGSPSIPVLDLAPR